MRLSRRQLLRQIGAGAAGAAAAPGLAAAAARPALRGPSLIRLSSNENAYGPSPAALAAVRALDDSALSRYPDVEVAALRRAIARLHGVPDDRIVVGCGSA